MSSRAPADGPGDSQALKRLIQLLLGAYRINYEGIGWKVQRSPNRPNTATTRLLETCDPTTRTIILYEQNHRPSDGPLEQTLLHALLHTSFMLSSNPKEERIVLALERLLWPRLPATYHRWLKRLVKGAERGNGRYKVDPGRRG